MRKGRRRGISLLPSIITTLNVFCGFYAIISAVNGNFVHAAIAIIIAGLFDALDGKIARATKTESRFGLEYDSLADLISFGLAPALMAYLWALKPLGRFGWLAGFLFMVCGALRLARFNTHAGGVSSRYFQGLPIPASAGMVAATVLFFDRLGMMEHPNPFLIIGMLYVLAFLMVSTAKYTSFKKLELFQTMKKFDMLVLAVLILVSIASQPSIALFLLALAYVISGPLTTVLQFREDKRKKADALELDEQETTPV